MLKCWKRHTGFFFCWSCFNAAHQVGWLLKYHKVWEINWWKIWSINNSCIVKFEENSCCHPVNSRTFPYSCISYPARARQILWWGHGRPALGGLRHSFRLDWGSLGCHCSLHFGQRHVWNVGQNPAFIGSMHQIVGFMIEHGEELMTVQLASLTGWRIPLSRGCHCN